MGRHIVKYKVNRSILPTGYTQLEYIESSGTQYIATGISTTSQTVSVTTQMASAYLSTYTKTLGYSTTTSGPPFSLWATTNNYAGYGTQNIATSNITQFNDIYMYGSVTIPEFYIFDVNPNVSGYARTTGKIKITTITVDGVTVRNLIPAKNSSNVVGMYDTITETFFTNSGTGDFIAGPEGGSIVTTRGLVSVREGEAPPEMPTGYTAVKAIYSNGSQYFQTTWIPDFTKDIIIDGDVGFVRIDRGMWFANYGSPNDNFSIELYNNLYLRLYNGGDYINVSTAVGSLNTLFHATYNYTASTGAITLNCSTGAYGSSTFPSGLRVRHNHPVWFGTDNSGHRYPYGYFGKLKITEGGVDVIDYQPCKRDSDGVYGMYDFVNNTFYPSSTGTNFLLGEVYVTAITPHAIKTREVNN